jgi:hypothetical protein
LLDGGVEVREGECELLPSGVTLSYEFEVAVDQVVKEALVLVDAHHLMEKGLSLHLIWRRRY